MGYYANFAVAFGEGPAVDVLRLWAGETLIFDRRDPVAEMPEGWSGPTASLFTGQSKYKYKIHLGTEDQEPDGLIVRKVLEETGEADAVPAHRGLVYIVFDRLPFAEWNNQIPPITAEIAWSGDRPATVRNASFLSHDGGTSFQRNGMAVDFARGYLYLEGNGGMHRIRPRICRRTCTSPPPRRGPISARSGWTPGAISTAPRSRPSASSPAAATV